MAQRRRCANTPRRSSGACPNTILSFRNLHTNRDSLKTQHNLKVNFFVKSKQTGLAVFLVPSCCETHMVENPEASRDMAVL